MANELSNFELMLVAVMMAWLFYYSISIWFKKSERRHSILDHAPRNQNEAASQSLAILFYKDENIHLHVITKIGITLISWLLIASFVDAFWFHVFSLI